MNDNRCSKLVINIQLIHYARSEKHQVLNGMFIQFDNTSTSEDILPRPEIFSVI